MDISFLVMVVTGAFLLGASLWSAMKHTTRVLRLRREKEYVLTQAIQLLAISHGRARHR